MKFMLYLFLFIFWFGLGAFRLALKWHDGIGLTGLDKASLGVKKTRLLNGAGSTIKKPALNPTHCHSKM